MDREIEIQVKIEKKEKLLEFLKKEGKFVFEKHQIDEYFSPISDDFLKKRPVKNWLRLRNADRKYSINYKNWHFDKSGKSNFCDEYETKVEDLGQMKKILEALKFESIVVVDKIRKIWNYGDYEIAIDSIKNLGDFVEIEYKSNNKDVDPKKITDVMIEFLKKIGVGKIERNYVGYPFMMLFPNEVKEEKIV